jgi:NAD+ synthetase
MSPIGLIAIAQIDPVVGDFEGNVKKIGEAYARACAAKARLLVTPELGLCGYPLNDLVERPEIFERNERALKDLAALTEGKTTALAVGHVSQNAAPVGRAAENRVSILEKGEVVFSQAKTLLPTYDIFDEARYFEPAESSQFWSCDGHRVGIAICEDLWAGDPWFGRQLYRKDPVQSFEEMKVELVISLSASPYLWGKREHREDLHARVATRLNCPLIYVNQVGANDEVLFDGGSFAVDASGKLVGRLPLFQTAVGIIEVASSLEWKSPVASEREDKAPEEIEVLSRALVTGIRDYFDKTGFKIGIIGLSGGIDSAVVATLAAQALGPKNLLCVAMPSQYSSAHSLEDADLLAKKLGAAFEVRPIKFLYSTMSRELSENRGALAPLASENLQARLRGGILMTLSNHYSGLVLTTGNKSEIATGYCTLYGDMCGAFAPIGDVFKTRVYELARHLNAKGGNPIPERTLTKPPSAELRPGQTDQETLPPYDILDELLEDYLEKGASARELVAKFDGRLKTPGWVKGILRMVEQSEYKRRQSAPVLKTSSKAFGLGRRIPVAKRWSVEQ